MKEPQIRAALEEVKRDLRRLDDERDVLMALVTGYEGWLRLHGTNRPTSNGDASRTPVTIVARDHVSFRSAVLNTLKDAKGEPLRSKEILRRALGRGAVTQAKDPIGITDLMCYSLAKSEYVVKSAPRTWRHGTKAEWEAWKRENPPKPGRKPAKARGGR